MKNVAILVVCVVASCVYAKVASTAVAEPADQPCLTSRDTVLTFDRATGDVAHLIHKPTGREFAATTPQPLFTITLVDPATAKYGAPGVLWARKKSAMPNSADTEEIAVDSHGFRQMKIERESPRRLKLSFLGQPQYALSATVTAEADDTGAIRLRLSVKNYTKLAIRRILFPRVPWTHKLGESVDDDRLLIPFYDGELIEAPGRKDSLREADYPGMACVQFAAYYDRQAGVYLATEDGGGNPKLFQRDMVTGRYVAFSPIHLFEESSGNDVYIDYDVLLQTFVGDWRDAAGIYKMWAAKQFWCAKKLAERENVPAFLREGAGILIDASFHDAEFTARKYGKDLELLPEWVSEYHKRTGLAYVVFVPYGWENRGTWAGINYFPAKPSDEAWARVAERLRANSDQLMFLPSGFWWVVKRQDAGMGPAFDDSSQAERLKSMLIANPDGTPWCMDNYDLAKKPGQYWRGLSMHLCHGSEQARQTMKDIFLHAARLGVSLVSFDQEQGAAQYAPCYDTSHGHGRGYGPYIWEGFRKTCEMVLSEGKAIEPDLGLCLEDTCELAIPWMATYWSRQFKGGFDEDSPTVPGYPNSVGLFSYIYHEYTTAIGGACIQGQGDQSSKSPAELRCFILSNNLCRGLIPGPFATNVPLDPKDKWHQLVSNAYFSFCQPYAHFPEYLVLGETIRPPKVECAKVTIQVQPMLVPSAKQPAKPAMREVRFPAVNAGSFMAADGSVAVILANATDKPQSAKLSFPDCLATLKLYDASRREISQWADVVVGQNIPVDLEAFGTRILIVRR